MFQYKEQAGDGGDTSQAAESEQPAQQAGGEEDTAQEVASVRPAKRLKLKCKACGGCGFIEISADRASRADGARGIMVATKDGPTPP